MKINNEAEIKKEVIERISSIEPIDDYDCLLELEKYVGRYRYISN